MPEAIHHTDFASTAAAPAYDPWASTMARNAVAVPPAPVDTTVAPPSLALHARQTTHHLADAPLPGAPDAIDRTFHPAFPISAVEIVPASAPFPGTVPATTYDPWRPLQHFPTPQPVVPPRVLDTPEGRGKLDADLAAAQFATVARSRAKLDRARAYVGRLGGHATEIRGKLAAAAEHQVAAAIGTSDAGPADVGSLRGELVTVDRQHRQALAALADIEAEHVRHEADFSALTGSDGTARAKLAEAHEARALAQRAADDANALLDRATAHAESVHGRLTAARADEARHDADATARLRAALADGDALPKAAEPFVRTSSALEDDLRHACAAVDTLTAEHAGKLDALAIAHRAVLATVDGVLLVDAETAARELQAADARALTLRIRLHCYANRRAADWVAPVAGPPKVHPGGWVEPDPAAYAIPPAIRQTAVIGAAIASAPVPQSGGMLSDKWTAGHGAWDRYAAALTADPQAEPVFTDEPSSRPPAVPAPASRAA